jgi:hypothetical protein
MGAAEPDWLKKWADASAVLLLIELCVLLVIVTALVFMLAYGARWLKLHVMPVLNATVPRAQQALHIANESSDRVVRGVAEVYGIRQALEIGLRVLLSGRQSPLGAAAATPPSSGTVSQEAATPPPTTTPRPVATSALAAEDADEVRSAPGEGRAPAGRDRRDLTAHAG